jgi:uncharacterized protein
VNFAAARQFVLDTLQKGLDPALSYHGLHHTLDVERAAAEISVLEDLPSSDRWLVQTAALFHDAGFLWGHEEHEQRGCALARRHLPDFGYSPAQIAQVTSSILATSIPQQPRNLLEKILCDADLDYLGREDFFAIADTLFRELQHFGRISDRDAWNIIQIQFLDNHTYFTDTNKRRRETGKQFNLEVLKKSCKI